MQSIGKNLKNLDFRDKTRQFRREYFLECVLANQVLPFKYSQNIKNT